MLKYLLTFIVLTCFISKANAVDLSINHGDINTTIGVVDFGNVDVGSSADTILNFYNSELVDVLDSCGTYPSSNSNFSIVSQTCGDWTGARLPDPYSIALAVNSASSCSVTIRYTPTSDNVDNSNFQFYCNDSSYNGNTRPYFLIDFNASGVQQASAPVITSSPSLSVYENTQYEYIFSATDNENDAIIWSIKPGTNLPSWLIFDSSGYQVDTFSGTGNTASTDGDLLTAEFYQPADVKVDALNNIYVVDRGSHKIRKIDTSGNVTTLAGSGVYGYADGIGVSAAFKAPNAITVGSNGIVYVADTNNQKIRKIDSLGNVSTLAGSFGIPYGVAVDGSDNLYITSYDKKIRRVTPAGVVSIYADLVSYVPTKLAVDGIGNVYVTSQGSNLVLKVDSLGTVTVFAGSGASGDSDGAASTASFDSPNGIVVDSEGNVYVGDSGNNKIRKIDASGYVTTLAGTGSSGNLNGSGSSSTFSSPWGISLLGKHVFVADHSNNLIRKITPPSGLTGLPSNSDVGDHSVCLSASDGINDTEHCFTISVTNINDAPTISGSPALVIDEDSSYSFMPTVTDIDASDSHSFSISNKPSWATFNTISGLLSGAPTNSALGIYSNIVIMVTDAAGASDSLASFNITVNNTNDAPIISGSAVLAVNEDTSYSFMPSATDIDLADTYSYSISNQPQWADFDSITGTLSGIPTNADVGVHSNIIITVTDAAGATDSLTSFNITVNNTNDAPLISGSPDTTINEGSIYRFTPLLSDIDVLDSHSFSITGKPSWATFNVSSGLLSGSPANIDVGTSDSITISVTDLVGAADILASFTITVINTNDAPIITGSPTVSVEEDMSYSFIPSTTDIDLEDTYTYSISNQPQWADFDSLTGTLSGIPTSSDVGVHSNIIITVTDAAGAGDSLPSFNITVNNTNDAPIINAAAELLSINDKQEGMPFANVLLSDDDGIVSLTLNFDASNGILAGDGLSGDSGVYSIASQSIANVQTILQSLRFIPKENQVSAGNLVDTVFSLMASDGLLNSDVNNSIQVSAVSINDAPIVYGQSIRAVEGSISEVEFIAEDLENDVISFSQQAPPAHGELNINAGIGLYISDQGFYGADSFSIVANDGIDDSSAFVIDVKVVPLSDEGMAVNDTIYLPLDSISNIYELDVLANDNLANNPQVVSILSLVGETSIANNKVLLYLDDASQAHYTLTYVIKDSVGRYGKTQVNLVIKN
jgi:sugar lactone lactonase YvrE